MNNSKLTRDWYSEDSVKDILVPSLNTWRSRYDLKEQLLLNDNTFYAYTRVVEDYIPSFICLSDKVTSKVALLTVDEVLFAGASPNEENTSYYLYNESIETDSFLMSSSKLVNGIYYPFALSKNGKVLSDVSGSFLRSVRPVITIIKTALVEGDGTSSNPYKLISN